MPVKSWSEKAEARLLSLKKDGATNQTIVARLQKEFPGEAFSLSKVKSKLARMKVAKPKEEPLTVTEKVEVHRTQQHARAVKKENRELLEELANREKELEVVLAIKQTTQQYTITPKGHHDITATQIAVWSDWHVEEIVKGETVNHLNEFNLEIADYRIQRCIENTARLMEITSKDIPIDGKIIVLGGDFISGHIHDELKSNTCLLPAEAIIWVRRRIKAGLEYLLAHTTGEILVVCHSGNHARTTEKTHFATEAGNSLEYIMYHFLKDDFAKEKRLKWLISEGYHSYVDLYERTIRFHHGHAVKFGGGVGGLFIPANKAIAQWNKAKHADLDVFGHFHQMKNGGNFICNGSLIGWNAYAISIKADFERPRQKFFMYASSGEVIAEHPIFLE